MLIDAVTGLGFIVLVVIACWLIQFTGYVIIAARLAVDIVRPNLRSSGGYRWWNPKHNWVILVNFWDDFVMFLGKPLDTTDVKVYGDGNKFWWGGYGNWWYAKDGVTHFGKNYELPDNDD